MANSVEIRPATQQEQQEIRFRRPSESSMREVPGSGKISGYNLDEESLQFVAEVSDIILKDSVAAVNFQGENSWHNANRARDFLRGYLSLHFGMRIQTKISFHVSEPTRFDKISPVMLFVKMGPNFLET